MSNPPSKRSIVLNAAARWFVFVGQIAIAFFMSPFLVHSLGDRRYGMWSLLESVLAYLMLLDLGVAASVVRFVARFEATRDRDSLNRVFSTSVCLSSAAGVAALVLAVGIAFGEIGRAS